MWWAFHLLAERLDGFRIGAGQARFHHSQSEVVAVLDEVERLGAAARRACPYGEAGRRATQVGQLFRRSLCLPVFHGEPCGRDARVPSISRVIISELLPT